jgi:hypothetical protein
MPVPASQILAVPLPKADAGCCKSCENTTDLTESRWSSTVWRQGPHLFSMISVIIIHSGSSFFYCSIIKLHGGPNTSINTCAWRGAFSVTHLLKRINHCASRTRSSNRDSLILMASKFSSFLIKVTPLDIFLTRLRASRQWKCFFRNIWIIPLSHIVQISHRDDRSNENKHTIFEWEDPDWGS